MLVYNAMRYFSALTKIGVFAQAIDEKRRKREGAASTRGTLIPPKFISTKRIVRLTPLLGPSQK
jgi:hypothetical protein